MGMSPQDCLARLELTETSPLDPDTVASIISGGPVETCALVGREPVSEELYAALGASPGSNQSAPAAYRNAPSYPNLVPL